MVSKKGQEKLNGFIPEGLFVFEKRRKKMRDYAYEANRRSEILKLWESGKITTDKFVDEFHKTNPSYMQITLLLKLLAKKQQKVV